MSVSTFAKGPAFPTISALFGLGIGLQAFGSVYRPEFLGTLASSPGSLVLLVAVVLSLLFSKMSKYVKYTIFLFFWGLLVSFGSLVYFGWDDLYFRKFFSISVLMILWLSPVLCLENVEKRYLEVGLILGISILFLGYILSDVLRIVPSSIYGLLFGNNTDIYFDSRPRSFMSETSHFSGLLGRYAICLFLLVEVGRRFSPARLFFALASIGAILFYIQGKGAAIALIFAMVASALNKRSIPYLVLIIPLGIVIGNAQLQALGIDIEKFSSTSTRTVLIAGGLLSVTSNPFGYGFYGFYEAIRQFGGVAADAASSFGVNLSEVDDIIYTFENVSSKSTLVDFVIIFGFSFLVYLFAIIRGIDLKDPRALSALVFVAILGLSTSGNETIPFFLAITILLRYYPSQHVLTLSSPKPVAADLPRYQPTRSP